MWTGYRNSLYFVLQRLAQLVVSVVFLVSPLAAHEREIESGLGHLEKGTRWFQARALGVEGKGWEATSSPYQRFPDRAQKVVRPPVWDLSQHSAGMVLRFVTDATSLSARWTLTSPDLAMSHMPATGVSGLDLYVKVSGQWRWLNTPQPTAQSNTAVLVQGLVSAKREFLLYFPLYNGVSSVELGIPAVSRLWSKRYDGEAARPLVFWGTSITQGACASRPGMVHTAILGRRLDRPVMNFGFSGNGRMEPEVARLISEIDAAIYVIDCCPNLDGEQVRLATLQNVF